MSLDYPLSVPTQCTHILSCMHVSVYSSIMHEVTFSNFPAFSVGQILHTVYTNHDSDGASHNYTVGVLPHSQSLVYWLVFQIQVGYTVSGVILYICVYFM